MCMKINWFLANRRSREIHEKLKYTKKKFTRIFKKTILLNFKVKLSWFLEYFFSENSGKTWRVFPRIFRIILTKIIHFIQDLTIDMKIKPSVTLGIGRKNSTVHMASFMFCDNQVRVNHFQNIGQSGTVSFNLRTRPRYLEHT